MTSACLGNTTSKQQSVALWSSTIMAPSAILPERGTQELESLTTSFDDTIRFYLNGTRVVLDEVDPEVTVLEYLRGIGLTGTKL